MTVSADAQELDVYAACLPDGVFIFEAVGIDIFRLPLQAVDVFTPDVDMGEQVIVHVVSITLGMILLEPEILIEIEGAHL